jgi:hypothetical protein
VSVEQSLPAYEPTPSQQPSMINASPTAKISTSVTSQVGMRPSSPVIRTSCQALTSAPMIQLTHPHRYTAQQHRMPLRHAACCAQPYGGEARRSGQTRSSARCINGNRHRGSAANARSVNARSFRTPSTAHASVATAEAGKDVPRRNFTGTLQMLFCHARQTRVTFLRSRDFRNSGFTSKGCLHAIDD